MQDGPQPDPTTPGEPGPDEILRQARGDLVRANDEIERQRRFYETLIGNTPDLIYAWSLDYKFRFANQALLNMWGRTLADSVGKRLIEVGYEPWHAEMHEREIDHIVATREVVRGEVGFPHATDGWRIYDYILTPVLDAHGEVELVTGITRDITDLKRAEEHLKLLVDELNHRVKNTLATVQSIAAQTFRGAEATPDARAAFEARLIALSDVHTVLTGANWEGANLREVAGRALAPFRDRAGTTDRVEIRGGDIQLRPQAALALAMAFHELAANAAEHGALSGDEGRVTLDWSHVGDRLHIAWRETGGPAVKAPAERGFGSRLIEQGLARELDGTVVLDYSRNGVTCAIDIPGGGNG
jgi:PAS domain S-box-containing protein